MQIKHLSAAIAALIASSQASAVGFGEVAVDSFIGEPLAISIPISGSVEALNSVTISLASPDEHARYGVAAPASLWGSAVSFDGSIAQLNTPTVFQEAYVNALLRVESLDGIQYHRISGLVDPKPINQPSFVPRAQVPVVATSVPVIPSQRAKLDNGGYGPIKIGESLFTVAQKLAPSSSMTVSQMMTALHQSNLDSFVGGDINRLQAGSVLTVPQSPVSVVKSPVEAPVASVKAEPSSVKIAAEKNIPAPVADGEVSLEQLMGTSVIIDQGSVDYVSPNVEIKIPDAEPVINESMIVDAPVNAPVEASTTVTEAPIAPIEAPAPVADVSEDEKLTNTLNEANARLEQEKADLSETLAGLSERVAEVSARIQQSKEAQEAAAEKLEAIEATAAPVTEEPSSWFNLLVALLASGITAALALFGYSKIKNRRKGDDLTPAVSAPLGAYATSETVAEEAVETSTETESNQDEVESIDTDSVEPAEETAPVSEIEFDENAPLSTEEAESFEIPVSEAVEDEVIDLKEEEVSDTSGSGELVFDEERIDIIGQNGNDGLHYDEETDAAVAEETTHEIDEEVVDEKPVNIDEPLEFSFSNSSSTDVVEDVQPDITIEEDQPEVTSEDESELVNVDDVEPLSLDDTSSVSEDANNEVASSEDETELTRNLDDSALAQAISSEMQFSDDDEEEIKFEHDPTTTEEYRITTLSGEVLGEVAEAEIAENMTDNQIEAAINEEMATVEDDEEIDFGHQKVVPIHSKNESADFDTEVATIRNMLSIGDHESANKLLADLIDKGAKLDESLIDEIQNATN